MGLQGFGGVLGGLFSGFWHGNGILGGGAGNGIDDMKRQKVSADPDRLDFWSRVLIPVSIAVLIVLTWDS